MKFLGFLFTAVRDGQGEDQGKQFRRFLLHQAPVQLGGLLDQSMPVHAYQPEVGSGLDHLSSRK